VVQLEGDVLAYCVDYLKGSSPTTLLVIHDPGLPSTDELVDATKGRQHIAHRLDALAWRRYWRRWLPRFDSVVNLTRDDARAVTQAVPSVTPLDIPLGIDIPAQPLCPLGSGSPGVVFVGGYNHTPNIDAAIRLMSLIMPRVRAQAPELQLTIVGDSPTAEMRDAAGEYDEITGRVSAVAPYLDRASLVVLPIRLGGGMRVKLLEALAAGKAVVASPVAAAGLHVDGRQVLRIADSDEEFSATITELLGDDAARAELGRNARRWALENLSWSSRRAQYEKLYFNLLDRTSAPTESETLR
jgi:glycosyltransferase involved in cell wall biosynthesis